MRGKSGTPSRLRRTSVAALLAFLTLAGPAPMGAAAPSPYPDDLSFVVRGGGWGHGHGMSQYGARGQADEGRTWREILHSYYSGVSIADKGNAPIRVLLRSSGAVIVGGLEDYVAAWKGGDPIRHRTNAYPYTRVRPADDGVVVARGASADGPWDRVAAGSRDVVFTTGGPAVPVAMNGRLEYYRGSVVAVRRSAGTLYTINVLPMDEYLYGVVPREMPALWPDAAIRAQSVAARSYAAWKRASVPDDSTYDICADTYCQMYRGYGYRDVESSQMVRLENSNTNDAVDATTGQTMVADGDPIFAEFHSSSGGHTSQGSRPYLAPRPDPWDAEYSPYNRWETRVGVQRIEDQWPQLGDLAAITDVVRDGEGAWGGRVKTMKFVGTDGTLTVSGDAFRSAMGLRSTLFEVLTYDAAFAGDPGEVVLTAGGTGTATVLMRNTGSIGWPVGETVKLGTAAPRNRTSAFQGAGWLSATRAGYVTEDVTGGTAWVKPGEVGAVRFEVRAPLDASSGLYLESFRLVTKGFGWFGDAVNVPMRIAFGDGSHLGANLVRNASFESADATAPAGWTADPGDGGARANAGAVDASGSLRQPAVATDDEAVRTTIRRPGAAGDRFSFGAWSRARDTSTGGDTIDAVVRFFDRDGEVGRDQLLFPKAPHDWTYRETIVTAPARYRSIEVSVHVRRQRGTVWWDRVRLIRQDLRNGSFERGTVRPRTWTITGGDAGDGRSLRRVRAGNASLKLAAHGGADVRASQTLALSGPAGDVVRIGGWNRAVGSVGSGGPVRLWARFLFTDGTGARATVRFPRAEHDWAYGEILAPAAKAYDGLEVHAQIKGQHGAAWFDDLVLTRGAGVRTLSANASFELGTPSPGEWWVGVTAPDAVRIGAASARGLASLRVDGADAWRYVRQQLPLAGEAGDAYVLSGWTRTVDSSRSLGAVQIRAVVRYADGTSGPFAIDFARGPHEWHERALTLETTRDYTRIDVYAVFSHQTGSAWFDDIRLEPAQS